LSALQELADPQSRLTMRQRQELVDKIVRQIDTTLPQINDPQMLWRQATMLIQNGAARQVNTLEYWGENPRVQASLRPIVEAIIKILDRCQALALAQAEQIAGTIRSPDDPAAKQYMVVDNLATMARYTRLMVDYDLALAIDSVAGGDQRRQIAGKAIQGLAEFDNADSSVQAQVRNRVAKLKMAAGDFAGASETFAEVIGGQTTPPPTFAQQYEARYFSAVCLVLSGKLDGAQRALAELISWQEQNIPPDNASARQGAQAAAEMLEYRLHSARAQLAKTPADRAAADKLAMESLLKLVKERPDLRGIVYEQLAGRLPEHPDMKQLDVLLLQALIQRGNVERMKNESESADPQTLQHAIDAARELVRRRGSGVDAQLVEQAALLEGFFLDRLDRDAQAAGAFLDFIRDFPHSADFDRVALDNARALVGQLMRANPSDPTNLKLYERFLSVAVGQFQQVQFAFEYGRLLQKNGQYAQAIKTYQLVAEDDPRLIRARFYQMVALNQMLDDPHNKPAETDRKRMVAEIQRLATVVDQMAAKDSANPEFRSLKVKTALLAAKIANREQHDPKRALELLADFEPSVRGMNDETDLLSEALFLRVDSYMDLGQNAKATDALVELLKTREGGQGARIIFGLLQKLDHDLDEARLRDDRQQMLLLARSRATLSGYLVQWAADNPDERIRRFTYRYRVFDADTRLLSAQLEEDPAAKNKGLHEALARYQALQTPQAVGEYQRMIAGTEVDVNYPDPAVTLGIARAEFDLGDFRAAQPLFARLLADKKLGTEQKLVDGELEENELFWESTYKLLFCNVELAKADANGAALLDETRRALRFLYIKNGPATGGRKWHAEFESLRQRIIPDFKVEQLTPATQPAS
jgi:tetratricopeptide (TPR) repeat protein